MGRTLASSPYFASKLDIFPFGPYCLGLFQPASREGYPLATAWLALLDGHSDYPYPTGLNPKLQVL